MASRKKKETETPTEAPPESKKLTDTTNYGAVLQMKGKKKELREYDAYVREHNRRLRQLEREARGIVVPGDHDGGY